MGERADMLREMYACFNRRDPAAAGQYMHPDAELHQNPEMPGTGVYIGLAEFTKGFREFLEGWRDFRFEVEDIVEEGEFVVMRMGLRGWGKDSGIEIVQNEIFHAWTVRDGKAHRCVIRPTREAALEDARRLL